MSREPNTGLHTVFTDKEIKQLDAARCCVDAATATIAFCVYENPFAKSGGIFAVANHYCSHVASAGREVMVLTPYHSGLATQPSRNQIEKIGELVVPFGGEPITVELLEYQEHDVRWVLIRAKGFFDAEGGPGRTDPYSHADSSKLLIDSLFLCQAIPHVLNELGCRENVILHLQDWQLATTALTVKLALLRNQLTSAAVVLTLHNPYDQGLSAGILHLITHRRFKSPHALHTVYQYMLPLIDGPLTTVSHQFAKELIAEPLQTRHFAKHLQSTLAECEIVGVNNGLFGNAVPGYSDSAVQCTNDGDAEKILEEKLLKRRQMLEVLTEYEDERTLGKIDGGDGRPLTELDDDIPIFMMFGRQDPGQKGFDILARAIEAMPARRARFILTPIVVGNSKPFDDDLAQLAKTRPGDVVVYPFRMTKGYMEAMAGATFAVMPSLYEPFGGASEPYLAGTPVISRATGGLVLQVVDIDEYKDQGTGIVYREYCREVGDQWSQLQGATTPEARAAVPIYGAMVASLVAALTRAAAIYESKPNTYARMLANLFPKAVEFSWERTGDGYSKVYHQATSRTTI